MMAREAKRVVPTTGLCESALVRLCDFYIVQAVERHDGTRGAKREGRACGDKLSKPCVCRAKSRLSFSSSSDGRRRRGIKISRRSKLDRGQPGQRSATGEKREQRVSEAHDTGHGQCGEHGDKAKASRTCIPCGG
jgi:hypothetical protein